MPLQSCILNVHRNEQEGARSHAVSGLEWFMSFSVGFLPRSVMRTTKNIPSSSQTCGTLSPHPMHRLNAERLHHETISNENERCHTTPTLTLRHMSALMDGSEAYNLVNTFTKLSTPALSSRSTPQCYFCPLCRYLRHRTNNNNPPLNFRTNPFRPQHPKILPFLLDHIRVMLHSRQTPPLPHDFPHEN